MRALKEAFPDSELFRRDPSHGHRDRPGEIGPNANRPFDPADPLGTQRPPPVIPQSLGLQSSEGFADRFGHMYDNRDQSSNFTMGDVNVSVPAGSDGSRIGQEAADAMRRALTIHGQSPATP